MYIYFSYVCFPLGFQNTKYNAYYTDAYYSLYSIFEKHQNLGEQYGKTFWDLPGLIYGEPHHAFGDYGAFGIQPTF